MNFYFNNFSSDGPISTDGCTFTVNYRTGDIEAKEETDEGFLRSCGIEP